LGLDGLPQSIAQVTAPKRSDPQLFRFDLDVVLYAASQAHRGGCGFDVRYKRFV
jgi:hypothetical protein